MAIFLTAIAARGQEPAATELAPFVVTATRAPQPSDQVSAAVEQFDGVDLRAAPELVIDDALRALPAFSLFRRSSSLSANPTAQGVSLRGIGPSGASRSLVLLDGVPLNDPFGGWVTWSAVPTYSLDRVEIVRGGGSGAWGNAALGGTLQLLSRVADTRRGGMDFSLGDSGTRRIEAGVSPDIGASRSLRVGGRWFETDGFDQFAPGDRGAIDRTLDSRHALGYADVAQRLASGFTVSAGASLFSEERGNGTPFQRNDSHQLSARVGLGGDIRSGLTLDVVGYAEKESFSSGFSSVDAARTTETPSLDQFDVPAAAAGASVVVTASDDARNVSSFGVDARSVTGETREDFFYSAGSFLRRRHAGGDQLTAGVFAARTQAVNESIHLNAALRLDEWRDTNGHRREWTTATDVVLRDEHDAGRSGTELSPSLGAVWQAARDWRLRASAYRAFRVPTLNELYRAFRVGNVATEANPALAPERLLGAEIGVEGGTGAWHWSVNAFTNTLDDAVANVTLSSTPSLVQRQRLNLDAVRARGLESELTWRSDDGRFALTLRHLWSDSRVREASVAPALVGLRLAQVPEHTVTLQSTFRPAAGWRIDVGARAFSAQFEDDANTMPLRGAVTFDVGCRWSVSPRWTISAAIENLFAARVETGRPSETLTSLDAPRSVHLGAGTRW